MLALKHSCFITFASDAWVYYFVFGFVSAGFLEDEKAENSNRHSQPWPNHSIVDTNAALTLKAKKHFNVESSSEQLEPANVSVCVTPVNPSSSNSSVSLEPVEAELILLSNAKRRRLKRKQPPPAAYTDECTKNRKTQRSGHFGPM